MQSSLFDNTANILPFDGEAYYYPGFFSASEADQYFDQLQNAVSWKQEPITLFGKQVMQPRLTAYYASQGKPYSYSGITMQPNEWTPELLRIRYAIESVAGVQFNAALLNQYRHGQDSMGWHRDNEKELGMNPVIGSVSFGATRKFSFRHYTDKKITRSVELGHGSFLLMKGSTQHCWEHQVGKTKLDTGVRINITFRVIV